MRFVCTLSLLVWGCATARPADPVPPPVVVEKTPVVVVEPEPVKAAEVVAPCAVSRAELDALPEKALPTIIPSDHVTLRRGACFGRCPVYSVTIFGDGRVLAMGERNVAQQGAQEWTIEPALAQRVLSEFVRVDAFSRKATMVGNISDLPTATLELSIGKQKAVISHYGAGAELQWQMGGKDNALITRLEALVDQASEAQGKVVCASDR